MKWQIVWKILSFPRQTQPYGGRESIMQFSLYTWVQQPSHSLRWDLGVSQACKIIHSGKYFQNFSPLPASLLFPTDRSQHLSFMGRAVGWDPVLSLFPPNLIHSLRPLMEKVSTMKEKQSSSVTWKTYPWVYARKIKYEDWEKSFFQPCPVSWCDSSVLYEVYVPATNCADLPPGHGQVKAGKGVGRIEEANTRAEFIGILIMVVKGSCSCTGSIMLDSNPLWKKWGVHHSLPCG